LGLPLAPSGVHMQAWNRAQIAAGALAMQKRYGVPVQFDTYACEASSTLHHAAEELHKPLAMQTIEVVLKLRNGITIARAEPIFERSVS
jgi:hypothetical protein